MTREIGYSHILSICRASEGYWEVVFAGDSLNQGHAERLAKVCSYSSTVLIVIVVGLVEQLLPWR